MSVNPRELVRKLKAVTAKNTVEASLCRQAGWCLESVVDDLNESKAEVRRLRRDLNQAQLELERGGK